MGRMLAGYRPTTKVSARPPPAHIRLAQAGPRPGRGAAPRCVDGGLSEPPMAPKPRGHVAALVRVRQAAGWRRLAAPQCIGADEFYCRYIAKNDLLVPPPPPTHTQTQTNTKKHTGARAHTR